MTRRTVLVIAVVALLYGVVRFMSGGVDIRNEFPGPGPIVCFGDSLTSGTGADRGRDYPSRLAVMLDRQVINAGIPGNTTAQGLARLQEDVLSKEPAAVFITLGGNDLKNGIDRPTAFANLREIVSRIQASDALVVLGGVDIPFYGKGFGKAYEELAEETGAVLVENVYAGILGRPSLMSDPIHPNNEGYAIMADHFFEAVKPHL